MAIPGRVDSYTESIAALHDRLEMKNKTIFCRKNELVPGAFFQKENNKAPFGIILAATHFTA